MTWASPTGRLPFPLPWSRGEASGRARIAALVGAAHAPVDIASLVYFRIMFGGIMLWEVYRYFHHGWINRYWILPPYNFPYVGFEWVRPWPGNGMYLHFGGMGILAVCLILGFGYRLSATLFFLGFTYAFLLEKANYLNHFYFVSLVSFLLIFVPAHRAFSLDSLLRPGLWSATAPAWALWLLRAQVGIVYFFGGVAKLNGDWLRGEPMRMWLAVETDFPIIGRWFTEEWMIYAFSYGGLLFDLLIVPALLWPRTRLPAFGFAVAFHLINARLFNIGIFPWFALAASVLFFPPDLPRRVVRQGLAWLSAVAPLVAQSPRRRDDRVLPTAAALTAPTRRQTLTVGLVALYLVIQVAVPLRHHLYPGNVAWTEEGHRFSWRMKLRSKNGEIRFFATDPATGLTSEINLRQYLTRRQIVKMATQPEMIVQFAHHVERSLMRAGRGSQEIRAEAWVSLNGRPPQLLVDPRIDLTTVDNTIGPASWIVPLDPNLSVGDGEMTSDDSDS